MPETYSIEIVATDLRVGDVVPNPETFAAPLTAVKFDRKRVVGVAGEARVVFGLDEKITVRRERPTEEEGCEGELDLVVQTFGFLRRQDQRSFARARTQAIEALEVGRTPSWDTLETLRAEEARIRLWTELNGLWNPGSDDPRRQLVAAARRLVDGVTEDILFASLSGSASPAQRFLDEGDRVGRASWAREVGALLRRIKEGAFSQQAPSPA